MAGEGSVTGRGSVDPDSAPSPHCSSLLTGRLQTPSDRATHRGDPRLQRVSSAGTTKGHGVAGCGASWKSLRGLRLSVGKLGKLSLHEKTVRVPGSASVLSRGPDLGGGPGHWWPWHRAGGQAGVIAKVKPVLPEPPRGGGVTVSLAMAPSAERGRTCSGTGTTLRR